MNALLPWHRPHWQNLIERVRAGRLPHALLLSGPVGLGKNQFAVQWAQTILCETGVVQGHACGQCRSCLLYAADSHPDLRKVSPLEPGKVIGVDQVREVSQYLSQTSQYGGHKAVIVTPAEQMNINAANSLLKTLEEPSVGSLILLVTDKPGRLPATILSRCQRIDLTVPGAEEATQWLAGQVAPELDVDLILALAEGAPLRALELAESNALAERSLIMQELERLAQGDANASVTAEQFLKIGARQTLYWMYHWVADMIRHVSGGSEGYIVNRDMRERLTRLAQRVDLRNLHAYIRQLSEALRMSGGQLNPQLAMENTLMAWQDTFLVRD
jgi:DNA polymerase-3 subunit delta'